MANYNRDQQRRPTNKNRKSSSAGADNQFKNYRGGTGPQGNPAQASRSGKGPAGSRPAQRPTASRNGGGQRPDPRLQAKANQAALKKKRRRKRLLKTLALLLAITIACLVYIVKFSNLNKDLRNNATRYNISQEAADFALQHRIVNVAIFGVDAREDVEGERSDTIMIATADYEHGGIKITSLMRDTYVYIDEEYGYDKLNAAYAYGGAELALRTINQNFDTAITDYATVDFSCLVEMVNAVGGVEVNVVDEEELYWINQYLMDVNDKVKTNSPFLETVGPQTLDGSQALAYARIRATGNGDFDRTARQRVIFEQVMQKALNLNPIAQYRLLTRVMPYVETSLSINEIMKYSINVVFMKSRGIQQARIPVDEFVATDLLGGVSYVLPDTLADNIKALYQFIYQAEYTPSARAQAISDEIAYSW